MWLVLEFFEVPKKLQEYQIDHTERRPKHTAIAPEVGTYDVAERANGARPGLTILQLIVQNKLYLKTGTRAGAAAADKEASMLTISDLVKNQDVKAFQDPQAIVKLLGHGWTKAYLMEVSQLTEQQALELLEMVQFLTMGQICCRGAFQQGPTKFLKKCWKCPSLAQTLLLVTLKWRQLTELLKMVKWIDEVMVGPKDTSTKKMR